MPPGDTSSDANLTPQARSILKILFVTLFLDLIGFSIIFPLFPAMLTYYLEREGDAGLLGSVVSALERFTLAAGGPGEFGVVVLFGGVLGSLYGLLQFLFAPVLGTLSDRYGRRPILLVSIAGIALSYLLWIFAGAFWLLVIARVIGGIMSANISTASAVVADVTSQRARPKGMAIIGIAFGLGFIVGPALGGLSALLNPLEHWPSWDRFGINPFSTAALAALLLSLFNLGYVLFRFPETLPARGLTSRPRRTVNPLTLFSTQAYPGVTRTNWINFLFLTSFAGMEFSLTFLALDRLNYTPLQNAYMFLFVGFILAFVQGMYVRKRAPVIGPKRMAVHGLLMTVPGLVLVGSANSSLVLYFGLLFMAVGAAQVIPCLTALVSLYAPNDEQGRLLGVFRSLGALARAVGPLIACVLYWRLGAGPAYYVGAFAVLLPALLATTLPPTASATPE